jgi:hypothetical protein
VDVFFEQDCIAATDLIFFRVIPLLTSRNQSLAHGSLYLKLLVIDDKVTDVDRLAFLMVEV